MDVDVDTMRQLGQTNVGVYREILDRAVDVRDSALAPFVPLCSTLIVADCYFSAFLYLYHSHLQSQFRFLFHSLFHFLSCTLKPLSVPPSVALSFSLSVSLSIPLYNLPQQCSSTHSCVHVHPYTIYHFAKRALQHRLGT